MLGRLRGDQGGATAIITAIAFSMLVGFVGLATEIGLWYAQRRAEQTASDAAALGAAFDLYKNGNDSTGYTAAGEADAAKNGFVNGEDNVTLTINKPPTSGPHEGENTAVEAILTKQRPTLFSALFTNQQANIETRSVATIKVIDAYCMMALADHETAALLFTGTADVQLKACGMIVNSDDADGALTAKGASVVGATYADVVGGVSESNNSTLNVDHLTTGADPAADPYKNVPVPEGSGCDHGPSPVFKVNKNTTATLYPGRYCGGLSISSGATVTLTKGVYVIVGGTFSINGTATVTSDSVDGVTIVLTGSGTDYAQVQINGGAHVNITATTSGTYKGLAFFQDRDAPVVNSGSPNVFNGGSTQTITGAIYIPRQLVAFSGGNESTGSCTRIVAYMISFSGTSGLNTDCTGYDFGKSLTWPPSLVE